MNYDPYPCQSAAIEHAVNFFQCAHSGDKQLYSGPTGVGKSIIELIVQETLGRDKCFIITPREEIIFGMLDKLNAPPDAEGQDYGIWTPIMLRNRLMSGSVRHPEYIIFDETHHHNANSWQQLDLLTGLAPAVGYTASPYRGTPKSTAVFREHWGDPLPIITYPEAIALGYIAMPQMSILPLVDDDIVDVSSGGEFEITSLETQTVDRLGDLADHAVQWHDGSRWDLPTIFAMPGTKTSELFCNELSKRGLPAAIVSSHHARRDRPLVFQAVEACLLALIHVNVVQEGVDLKLRRLVDCAPCMSPVKWVQQIGRIMRPWDRQPEYICTNRNVLRHAYILEGIVPNAVISETEKVFGESKRAHSRVVGLEAIGRFKPATVQLQSGLKAYVYSLSVLYEGIVVEYCCIAHPTQDPIWACKVNTVKDGMRSYGNWGPCEAPTDLRGFASHAPRELSPKQTNWWNRSAKHYGLKVDQEVTKKNFQALPVLADLGVKFT